MLADAKLSPGGVGVAPRQKAQIPDLRQLSHDTPVAVLPSPGVTVAAAAEHDFALVLSDGMGEVRIRLRREATPTMDAITQRPTHVNISPDINVTMLVATVR